MVTANALAEILLKNHSEQLRRYSRLLSKQDRLCYSGTRRCSSCHPPPLPPLRLEVHHGTGTLCKQKVWFLLGTDQLKALKQ